jgi:hypothetical protein
MSRPPDDFGPDPLDDALGGALRRLAPHTDDTDDVLDALAPRAVRARRRHQLTRATGIAAAITVVAGLGVLAAAEDPESPGVPFAGTVSTSTTEVPGTTTTTSAPATAPTSAPGGTAPTTGATSPSSTPSTSVAPTAAAPQQRTFTSNGGSVTVRLSDGALSIVAVDAAPGFREEIVREESDDVEVRFPATDGDGEARIRVRLQDGAMVEEIDPAE